MNSSVRNFLRSQAHSLKPIVMVGKEGADDRVVSALKEALSSHELVKVKFQAQKDEMRTLSEQLAQKTESDLISIIGFIATFYRESRSISYIFPRNLPERVSRIGYRTRMQGCFLRGGAAFFFLCKEKAGPHSNGSRACTRENPPEGGT